MGDRVVAIHLGAEPGRLVPVIEVEDARLPHLRQLLPLRLLRLHSIGRRGMVGMGSPGHVVASSHATGVACLGHEASALGRRIGCVGTREAKARRGRAWEDACRGVPERSRPRGGCRWHMPPA